MRASPCREAGGAEEMAFLPVKEKAPRQLSTHTLSSSLYCSPPLRWGRAWAPVGARQGASRTGSVCVLTLVHRGRDHLGLGPLGAWSVWQCGVLPLGFRSWGTLETKLGQVLGRGEQNWDMPHLGVWSQWEPWGPPQGAKGPAGGLPVGGRWSAPGSPGYEGTGHSRLWLP